MLLVDDPRLDRLASLGQLAQRGRVEVAVRGQRQRPRDRGRGHVQDMRQAPPGSLGVEGRALANSEAMLLVDHDYSQ
jgi:hypothetical protein